MIRNDGRAHNELRPVAITRQYLKFSAGSVLVEMGDTKVICTATAEERQPPFLSGTQKGWVTAEYSMLPGCSQTRIPRESVRGKIGGRTHEIQRLIGRSLRAVVDLDALGPRSITVDCDVIQADGGTRTASITGAFVALKDAIATLSSSGVLASGKKPLIDTVAAVSVGVVGGDVCLDLNYEEDSSADVDMNVVMTGSGKFIEVQGTAESAPFSHDELTDMIESASEGIDKLSKVQKSVFE